MNLPTRPERKRLRTSFGISLVLHGLILVLIVFLSAQNPAPRLSLSLTPITVAVGAAPPPAARSMVEAVAPTTESVGPTDLISDQNSKAQDLSEVIGKRPAPFFETPSEYDQMAGPASQEPIPPPPPREPPPKAQKPAQEPQKPAEKAKNPQQKPVPQRDDAVKRTQLAMARVKDDAAPPEEGPPASEAEDKPPAGPEAPFPNEPGKGQPGAGLSPGESKGRVDGGVLNQGFLGFEALKSDIAPYLKEVRTRVEQKWFAAMAFRYKGVSPTRAVVDCAIDREGKLVQATIREEGSIPLFARVCKESIEQAAPFPPFSFEVPDIYANKNLEIRWTFSFMK